MAQNKQTSKYVILFFVLSILVGIIYFLSCVVSYEQKIICSKETNQCSYSVNHLTDKTFVEQQTFSLTGITSVKMDTYVTTSSGGKHYYQKRKKITHYVIDLYYGEKEIRYPIEDTNKEEMDKRYNNLLTYIKDNSITTYEDTKKASLKIIVFILSAFALLMSLGILKSKR